MTNSPQSNSQSLKRSRPPENEPEEDAPSGFWHVSKRFRSHVKDTFSNVASFLGAPGSNGSRYQLGLPTKLLVSKECVAQTLTVSDQHATILLTTSTKDTPHGGVVGDDSKQQKETKSILKLTLVPFFRNILGSNPVLGPKDTLQPELKLLENDPNASKQILSFLQSYKFHLKSESGAEYSYYDAIPSDYNLSNAVKSTGTHDNSGDSGSTEHKAKIPGSFNVELISPASERQIKRAMPSLSTVLIEETPEVYKQVVQPYIQSIVDSGSLNWIFNIIEGKKEQERLLVNNDSFIINIDTKWRSHPDALKTPREEWYKHDSVGDLYCLGITKVKGIATMRDLTKDHIPMLEEMKREGLKVIEKVYGVPKDQIRVFVHYHPQFYHFHVHYTRLHNEIGSTVERGHLLSDIIQNLKMDGKFYSKRNITYKMKVSNPLYLLMQQRKNEAENNETN